MTVLMQVRRKWEGGGERGYGPPPFPQITLSHVNVPFFLFDKVDEKVPRPYFVGLKRSLRPYAIFTS